jgi:hypothetical protein
MTSLYVTEVAPYKLRSTAIAIFRAFDSGFGLVKSHPLQQKLWLTMLHSQSPCFIRHAVRNAEPRLEILLH